MNDLTGKRILWAILSGGLILRLALALFTDNLSHPDENFQIFEQAHRLVFGYGLIPWEFRYSVRSWLTPGLTAFFLYPFKWLGWDSPNIYIPAIRIILGVLSLWLVYSAYLLGRKIAGMKAGLVAAFLCAFWYEIAYFSIRPLSEVWATTFFVAALAISYRESGVLRFVTAAFLLALTAALRIQYLPLVILYFIFIIYGIEIRKAALATLALVVTIVGAGALDAVTLGKFYESYVNYIEINQHFSFGGAISPRFSSEFFLSLGHSSLYLHWVILAAALWFLRRHWIIPLSVVIVILLHSFLPLKDHLVSIRFIYLAIPLLMVSAGVIAADFLNENRTVRRLKRLPTIAIAVFVLTSAGGFWGLLPGESEVYRQGILTKEPTLQAYRYLSQIPNVVGIYDMSQFWFQSGGYFHLHKNVPIYFDSNQPKSEDYVSHVMTREPLPSNVGFRLVKSFGSYRLYERNDRRFPYRKDLHYSPDMYQPGIDDRLPLSLLF